MKSILYKKYQEKSIPALKEKFKYDNVMAIPKIEKVSVNIGINARNSDSNYVENVEKIVEFDRDSEKIAQKVWPGPLTLILKLTDEKIKSSLNMADKIAVRVPNHQCILELLKKCELIIGTSANISGTGPFRNPKECYENLHGYDVFLDGGIITSNGESTIIEFEDGELKIHRQGVLTREDILKIL